MEDLHRRDRLFRAETDTCFAAASTRIPGWKGPATKSLLRHGRTRRSVGSTSAWRDCGIAGGSQVSRRHERGSMPVTSNRSVAEWGGVFGDAVVATAILDRLLHHSHVITIRRAASRYVQFGQPLPVLDERLGTPRCDQRRAMLCVATASGESAISPISMPSGPGARSAGTGLGSCHTGS
ncbi:MAG TPA: ATP-binding protein [Burkholderiaceae bacterium]|nr:ATP-binding protein [Burkholderiaceae bacterium]